MNKKTIKKIIVFGLLTAVVLLVPLKFAHADLGDLAMNSAISIFTWGAKTILFLVGYVFSWGVWIGGLLLNWVLDLNAGIVDNPAVKIGWTLSRDITNMGFVLLIIIIAFGTILRMGSLTLKQTLPKLIIAALLINFSILIATVLLDGAGIFTSYFLNASYDASTPGGISQFIGAKLSLGSFLQTPQITGDLTTFGADTVKFIANLVFVDIMTAIGAITMITLAIMFLIRYVMIGILLIIMPAAILMWVIGSSQWGKWLDSFFKYTFFGPIAGFFIYIALQSADSFQTLATSKFINIEGDINGISGLVKNIGSEIMMVVLLMGGLMAAEKMSIIGAKQGVRAAKGAMKFIGKAVTKPYGLAGKSIGTGAKMGGAALSEKFGLSRFGKGKTGLAGMFARGVRQFGTGAEKVKETHGGLKDIPSAMLEEMSGKFGIGSRRYRLAEKQGFEKEDKETDRLAKKQVYFDSSKAGNATYMTQYNKDLAQADTDIRKYIKSQHNDALGTALEKTTKEFEKQAVINDQAGKTFRAGVYPDIAAAKKAVGDFVAKNAEDVEVAKKYFTREVNIANLMKQTGATKTDVEKALKESFDDANIAKKNLSTPPSQTPAGENAQFDVLKNKLTQLQNDLSREKFATNQNPQKTQQLQKDIDKAQQDIKKITG